MKFKKVCPRCSFNKIYVIRRKKWRCAYCKYEWVPYYLPLYLGHKKWVKILQWFLRGLSGRQIALETGINRTRILRALTKVRMVMFTDVPDVFSGTIEVDETYIGGQWKNKRKSQKRIQAKRGRGTLKTPIFGILYRGGKVWAKVVPDVESETLVPLIRRRVKHGSVICSDTWKSYTGIAAKGYVHRLVEHGKGEYTNQKGNHINGLEGFWGYLKRKLAAKGGIRKERLPLYLAEYVWRYNHRHLNIKQQVDKLLSLLYKHKYLEFSGSD
jgi:transposase-like protein